MARRERAQGQPDEAAPAPQGAPNSERGFAAGADLERAGVWGAQPHRAPQREEFVLWFDARCPTCKRALALLREHGIEPALRRYLEEPPTPEELRAVVGRLGLPPHALARKDADEYHAMRLSDRSSDAEVLAALVRHPRIVAAPLLVRGGHAVIARPPERVLELLTAAREASE